MKHLPEATRAALEKSGAMTTLQQYSLMASQFQTQGQNLKTFETGSLLLSGEDPKTGQKVEVTVEDDALRGLAEPRPEVVLEGPLPSGMSEGRVLRVERRSNWAEIEAEANGDGLLVKSGELREV